MDSATTTQHVRPDKFFDVHPEVRGQSGILMLRIIMPGAYGWIERRLLRGIGKSAPTGNDVVDYDRKNLALYAALLEADDAGRDWREAASSLMHLDLADKDAEACWRSHLERARWIVGEGLATALVMFNRRVTQ